MKILAALLLLAALGWWVAVEISWRWMACEVAPRDRDEPWGDC